MKYETRKRRLKRLIRPDAPEQLAECCGTPVVRAHKYSPATCECGRTWDPERPLPRRVTRLLDGTTPEEYERLTREIVAEFQDEAADREYDERRRREG